MTRKRFHWEWVLLLFLLLYPLRHINIGVDWWDTGYNYGNHTYGLAHMDSMWFFSTYLSNTIGHVMTLLPGGGTFVGMNFYTGLLVSALCIAGYFFATRVLGMHPLTAFLGEFIAANLCWCPTSVLYNYLTYVFFLACAILLYLGLVKDCRYYLWGAGICLGLNVFVRFSNLPEAGMILAVWFYAFVRWRKTGEKHLAVKWTLHCLFGYLGALGAVFGYISIKYGAKFYIDSVMRLFAMTEDASDYKTSSMLSGMTEYYRENLYWVLRMGVFVIGSVLIYVVCRLIGRKVAESVAKSAVKNAAKTEKVFEILGCIGAAGCVTAMILWLYLRGFCDFTFTAYGSILWPTVTFLTISLAVSMLQIVKRTSTPEERLLGSMVILIILLTSLGSNNKSMPSMNNLFLAAPYTLRVCGKALWNDEKAKSMLCGFPLRISLLFFLSMFIYQVSGFGTSFVFAEGTGLKNISRVIDNNSVLRGVRMSPERAQIMEEISTYANENQLKGREAITYGWIPSICYYLEMPPAFNSWSDLTSYQCSEMEKAMQKLTEQVQNGERDYPVIILEQTKTDYRESQKFGLIAAFMDKFNYDLTFENEKYAIYLPREQE